MNNSHLEIKFNEANGNYEIVYKGFSWISDGRKPYIVIRKKVNGKYISTVRHFKYALSKKTEYSKNKIITRYSNFIAFGKKLPFTLVCTAEITDDISLQS